MTPNIPLPPYLRRKRRNNILLACACMGLTLALAIYCFLPREAAEKTEAAASAAPAEEQAPHNHPGHSSEAPPLATTAEEPSPLDLPADDTDGQAPPANNTTLSHEELAKLPPWQQRFMKLELNQRVAFATAFTKAKEAYATKQWANCLALLNDCDLIYSGSPNVWNLRACALLENNELDEAQTYIHRTLELNPQDNIALMCQAELHMLRRDFRACLPLLKQLRQSQSAPDDRALHDTFTFHQLLCHLMLRQEMEARALVAGLTPLTDSPLYYFSQAAFSIYQGDNNGALEPLKSATTIYGSGETTYSYRKWMDKCGLTDKYIRNRQR